MSALRTEHEAAVETALGALDLDTKVSILSGQDMWSLPAVPEIGLASIVMSDGPIGVRGTQWSAADPSIALPSPTALAATWDPELARRAGNLLGQEARRKGVHVLLAPTVNLHRSPLGGRHFEAYSEDPLLTGAIGAGYVRGVQEHSVATTVKHFVANDAETERFTVDNQVSEKALRELYLAPFETIVAAGAWGVMAAYNKVNGTTMTEHAPLQRDVLKGEWGFDGFIVSDWTAARDTVATVTGGLDVAMPGIGSPWGQRLADAVRAGAVDPELVDDQVRRVLRLAARVGALDGVPPAVPAADRPAPVDGDALARELAARSFVLATNPNGLLPLDPRPGTVALIGALARDARILGGGSAHVFPHHVVSPLDGLVAAGLKVEYATGADPRTKLPAAAGPQWTALTATFRDASGTVLHTTPLGSGQGLWMELPPGVTRDELATVEITGRLTPTAAGEHELGIRGVGQFTLTAADQTVFDGVLLPDSNDPGAAFLAPPDRRCPIELAAGVPVDVTLRQQVLLSEGFALIALTLGFGEPVASADALLAEAVRTAAEADVAIVVVGTTEQVESEGFDRTCLALPGRQDELVARVAAANPNTIVVVNAGSPVELPWADDVAAVLLTWFPGQEAGHALADVLTGAAEPGGRLPTTWPVREQDCPVLSTTPVDGVLTYDEDDRIGYRAWAGALVAPRWWFGHGLGYTTWAYEQLTVHGREAAVTVRNTGTRPGRETVQVYVDGRLAGFAPVTAEPGQAATVRIALPERAFQTWQDGWQPTPGPHHVTAGPDYATRPLTTPLP
ncbi:glycoside hydrolase family 3 C-terminal domain-containing protein [Catellatospora tritici]|uniref:glycoside hydrolase family 3 C-terminal domain-containing protein n=1 Tax=Catellatospora tritici TaxID=2851566 RepID=UPI001C2DC84D|nr:glycoside hydrolase family 3 C-terminal domain-containing protein [Catellatospora tritici]MBV1855924.1 glycoside hydrolase family 3 C-terminal domain-containing protein [Catellatospora tritici]